MQYAKDQFDQFQGQAQAAYQQVSQILNPMLVRNCLDVLGDQQGVFIKQKFDFNEFFFGCDSPNSYKVYPSNEQGRKILKSKALFKCKEESTTCHRYCCKPNRRAFELKCEDHKCELSDPTFTKKYQRDELRTVFEISREYECTILCFNRPKLVIHHTEGLEKVMIGTIINPWFWYNYGCDVQDAQGNLRYKIEAYCGQTYFWVRFPCNACNYVEFLIKNANGEVVSHLAKKGIDCCRNTLGCADHFHIVFPDQATKEDKALLMIAILMLDYMYFEHSTSRNQLKVQPQ